MIRFIDMHCDTISELYQDHAKGGDASIRDCALSVNLDKLEMGGCGLQNFALFTHLKTAGDSPFLYCLKLADTFFTEMRANQERIGIVKSWEEIKKNWDTGRMSALLTVEEGGVCQGEGAYLRILYELVVRMMTLTWNFQNELGWPNRRVEEAGGQVHYETDEEHGLTETGIAFVEAMEEMGMIIDIAHLNDAGIWDVFRHTRKPFVASHSNCRALTPHPRNLTDAMIRELAERGGVAGMNFNKAFVMRQPGGNGEEMAYISEILAHIRHMKQVGGIGVIGLGSDFDGIPNPVEFGDASGMQLLAEAMERDGFRTGEIEAVFYGNVMRVYQEIL